MALLAPMAHTRACSARDEQAVWLSLRPDVAGWTRPKLDPDGAVISHRSAARLYGLGEFVNDRVELTAPRRRTMRDFTIHIHQAKLAEAEVAVVDGLPVTTPLRTICDLLDQHIDASHIATVIRQAVEAGQVRHDELAGRIGPYARRYGVKPFDGTVLLEQLLRQIGTSIKEVATRPSPVTWDELTANDVTWDHLARSSVTWDQLADMPPTSHGNSEWSVDAPRKQQHVRRTNLDKGEPHDTSADSKGRRRPSRSTSDVDRRPS